MPIINSLPYVFTNGTPGDATQVDADFNQIVSNVNANAASLAALNALSFPVLPSYQNVRVRTAGLSTVSVSAALALLTPSTFLSGTTLVNPSYTVNSSVSGAGGLDTGTVAASTWYYVYFIWGSTPGGNAIMSLSPSSPVLPATYTHFAYAGAVRTDASSNFWNTLQVGNRTSLVTGALTPYPGSVTYPVMASAQASAWTAISVTPAFVPPTATGISVVVAAHLNTTFWADVSPNNIVPVNLHNGIVSVGASSGGDMEISTDITLESSNIYYAASLVYSTPTVFHKGWIDGNVFG